MKVGILGAGAVALSSAVFLAEKGHDVWLWSAFEDERRALAATTKVVCEGSKTGEFGISVAEQVGAAVEGAEVVIIAVPAFGHEVIINAAAPFIAPGQYVVFKTATALGPVVLSRKLAERGIDATIVDTGTSICTSRKTGPSSVRVAPLKAGVGVATIPNDRVSDAVTLLTSLFGDLFRAQESVLTLSVNNHNPVYHPPAFIFNLALVARGEPWNIWAGMPGKLAEYVEQLDQERLGLVKALGISGIPLASYVRESVGVQGENLPAVFAAAAEKRPTPTGPTTLDDRYLTEDVPYGLAFFCALADACNVDMPLSRALVRLCSDVFGVDFFATGRTLDQLGLKGKSAREIKAISERGFPYSK